MASSVLANLFFSLLFCSVNCCKRASFNNTEMYLTSEGSISTILVNGCLEEREDTKNAVRIYASDSFVPALFEGAVSNLINLKVIYFTNIKLRRIEMGSFVNLPQLDTLNIGFNLISEVPGYMFAGLPLRNLFMSNNRIYYIEDKAFAIKSLTYLSLASNKIETFTPGWFDNSNLEVLLLTQNSIRFIPRDAFVNLKKLKVISFQANAITSVHKDAFNPLLNIEMIDLSCNKIKSLSGDIFASPAVGSGLMKLYLNGNSLTYLADATLRSLRNLKVFNFHNNPWQCPCYTGIKKWTEDKNITTNDLVTKGSLDKYPVCLYSESNNRLCSEAIDEEIITEFVRYAHFNCDIIYNYFLLKN